MGVKSTDFGQLLIEQYVGLTGEPGFPDRFLPIKHSAEGLNQRNASDGMGYSVDVRGNWAAVGSPYQDYDAVGENLIQDAGQVLVYRRNADTWEFAYSVVAP